MSQPETIRLEILNSNCEPVRLIDLGTEFLDEMAVPPSRYSSPFHVQIQKKSSKAGNAYYDYAQNGLRLPDGLGTFFRIEGAVIPMGKIHQSKSGYPTREGQIQVVIGSVLYRVTAYITEGKNPYWIKVVAHIQPNSSANIKKAQNAPRGGKIVF